MWFTQDQNHENRREIDLMDALPKSREGRVIFTTRDRETAFNLAQQVMKISDEDSELAKEIVRSSLDKAADLNEKNIEDLVAQLTYLPLEIVQAITYIKAKGIGIPEYFVIFKEEEQAALQLLSKEFEEHGRYSKIRNPVAIIWLILFN